MPEGGGSLSQLSRDVLELCEVGRTAGDIRFLHRDPALTTAAVESCLRELEARGLVKPRPSGGRALWSRTTAGSVLLEELSDWELVVEEVRRLGDRERPVVTGRLRRGVVYVNDMFLINGRGIGYILSVEFVGGPGVTEDAVSFTTNVEVTAGDVLTADEFLVA